MKTYAEVVIPPLVNCLIYSIPKELDDLIEVGQQVQVYIGKRVESGFIIGFTETIDFNPSKIKPIYKISSEIPYFTSDELPFYRWVAQYYGDSLSNVIDTAVPKQSNKKYSTLIKLIDTSAKLNGSTQQKIVSFLSSHQASSSEDLVNKTVIKNLFSNCTTTLRNLKERNIIEYIYREQITSKELQPAKEWTKKSVILTKEQDSAYNTVKEKIDQRQFQAINLQGVTGSGKTEVYIESCLYALQKNLSSLIIVPEIALTPQLVDRFYARFGPIIAVLHSGLEKRNRWDSWLALLKGEKKIAIGARSAVFAPLKDLGVIIVDEEHDASYKQADGFRYNARDIAIARAKLEKIPIILGSATPSLETFNNSLTKKYLFIPLSSKYSTSGSLEKKIINLNNYKPWEMASKNISPVLKDKISECLEKKEQVFILYNRRGFSVFVQCETCGFVVNCPRCSISMAYHKSSGSLICHLCGTTKTIPVVCPDCKKKTAAVVESRFAQRGAGTERVFDEIKQLFPNAKVGRLDRDSVNTEKDYNEVFDKIRSGETDILVGTQMIAKGHDIGNVTLVGIIDCDVGIHFPDFRAGERAFQLLTQVAGRAGRGDKPGTVIFQTRMPNHISIQTASREDYFEFAKSELRDRKSLNYPPFVRLLRIVALSAEDTSGFKSLEQLKVVLATLVSELGDAIILGPVSAPIIKIKNKYRHHIIIKSKSHGSLQKILRVAKECVKKKKDVKVIFDLDPIDML